MKRFLVLFILLILNIGGVQGQEYLEGNLTEDIIFKGSPVRITPVNKITTSKKEMVVGKSVDFVVVRDVVDNENVVIKKNTKVRGKVLSITPNRAIALPAKIVIGEFETTDVVGDIVPLKGEVKKEGNPHNTLISYLDFLAVFVRGGEVQIVPEDDYFIIFY